MTRLLVLLWGLLSGCAGELTAIPNTTTRVGEPQVERGTELELKIFTNPQNDYPMPCLGYTIVLHPDNKVFSCLF